MTVYEGIMQGLEEAIAYNESKNKTNRDYFFEVFPNAPKANGGYPVLCVRNVGLRDYLKRCEHNCTDCWDEQYKGE